MALHNETVNEFPEFLVPRSDATNAYDLLIDVARVIREEPLRYDQGSWLTFGKYVASGEQYDNPRGPECGTVGCRAGWICVLADGIMEARTAAIYDRARKVLGAIGYDKMEKDEDGHPTGEEYSFSTDLEKLFHGGAIADWDVFTPEYAEAGARGVEEFAEKWEERLIKTPITRG